MKYIRISALFVLFFAVFVAVGSASAQWYDPKDWFDQGGVLRHESDWYQNTFGYNEDQQYRQPYAHNEPYGYYNEQSFGPGYTYRYYSEDWKTNKELFDF